MFVESAAYACSCDFRYRVSLTSVHSYDNPRMKKTHLIFLALDLVISMESNLSEEAPIKDSLRVGKVVFSELEV